MFGLKWAFDWGGGQGCLGEGIGKFKKPTKKPKAVRPKFGKQCRQGVRGRELSGGGGPVSYSQVPTERWDTLPTSRAGRGARKGEGGGGGERLRLGTEKKKREKQKTVA